MKNSNYPSTHQIHRTTTVGPPGWEQVFDGRGGLVWIKVEPEVIDVDAVVMEPDEPQVIYLEEKRPSLVTHRYAAVLYLVLGVMVVLLVFASAIEAAIRSLQVAAMSLLAVVVVLVKVVILVLVVVAGLYGVYRLVKGKDDTEDRPPPKNPATPPPGAVTFNFYVNNKPE